MIRITFESWLLLSCGCDTPFPTRRSNSKTLTGFSKNRVHPVNRFKWFQLCVCVTKVIFVANTWKISGAFTFLNFVYLSICLFLYLFIQLGQRHKQDTRSDFRGFFSCVIYCLFAVVYCFETVCACRNLRAHVLRLHLNEKSRFFLRGASICNSKMFLISSCWGTSFFAKPDLCTVTRRYSVE